MKYVLVGRSNDNTVYAYDHMCRRYMMIMSDIHIESSDTCFLYIDCCEVSSSNVIGVMINDKLYSVNGAFYHHGRDKINIIGAQFVGVNKYDDFMNEISKFVDNI